MKISVAYPSNLYGCYPLRMQCLSLPLNWRHSPLNVFFPSPTPPLLFYLKSIINNAWSNIHTLTAKLTTKSVMYKKKVYQKHAHWDHVRWKFTGVKSNLAVFQSQYLKTRGGKHVEWQEAKTQVQRGGTKKGLNRGGIHIPDIPDRWFTTYQSQLFLSWKFYGPAYYTFWMLSMHTYTHLHPLTFKLFYHKILTHTTTVCFIQLQWVSGGKETGVVPARCGGIGFNYMTFPSTGS